VKLYWTENASYAPQVTLEMFNSMLMFHVVDILGWNLFIYFFQIWIREHFITNNHQLTNICPTRPTKTTKPEQKKNLRYNKIKTKTPVSKENGAINVSHLAKSFILRILLKLAFSWNLRVNHPEDYFSNLHLRFWPTKEFNLISSTP